MKKTLLVLALLSSTSLLAIAGDSKTTASFLDKVFFSGKGAMRKPNITGKSEYGAGFEVGTELNKYVKLGLQNLAYDTPDNWKGSVVDETALNTYATLLSSESKKTSLLGLGAVTRSWQAHDWAFGLGLGLRHNFTENFSIGVDAQIRAWFKQDKDLLATANLSWSF